MTKKKKNIIQILSAIFFLGIYGVLWYVKDIMTAKVTLIVMLLVVCVYFKNSFKINKLRFSIYDIRNWYQIGTITAIITLFLISAIVNKMNFDLNIPIKIYCIVLGLSTVVLLLLIKYFKSHFYNRVKQIQFDKEILIIIITTFLMRIPMFTDIQMWDGIIYYGEIQEACEKFDFTIISIWEHFRLAGHYTLAYTFFMSLGEFLLPGEMIGVQVVMMIMTSIALVCIYKMYQDYWCRMSKIQALVITIIISVIPNFYGMFSNINIDYFLVIFFIYLLYADYKKWEIMRFFWMFCVVLTKETGLFIIAGYSIAYVWVLWRESHILRTKERVLELLEDNLVKSIIIAVILLCCFVLIQGSLFTWMGIGEKSFSDLMSNYIKAANGKNLFLFVSSFVLHKMIQLFTMNFTWIPTLVIIFMVTKSWKKKKSIDLRGIEGLLGALIVFLLFSIFSTILVSAILSRYSMFSMVFMWISAIIIWFNEYGRVKWGKRQYRFAGCLIALLAIQSFVYIDPITNLLFDRLDTGNGKMVSGEKDYNNYGDTFVNNFYYRYIEELLNEMLNAIDYSEEWQIVMPYEREYLCLTGNVEPFSIGWDTENKRRTMSKFKGKKIIPINQINLFNIEELEPNMIMSKAIVYFMPYIECDEEEIYQRLEKYYEIGEKHIITNWGGSIIFYELEFRGDIS